MVAVLVISAVAAIASRGLLVGLVVRGGDADAHARDDGALRRLIADEAARSREETRAAGAALRQEVTALLGTLSTTLQRSADGAASAVTAHGTTQRQDLEAIRR